jgi:hypothetical protein
VQRPTHRVARVFALSIAIALGACTDAELEPIPEPEDAAADNKLQVEGEFCTTNPDDVSFPVKIAFVIDTSSSMETTDPVESRVDAIIEVIDALTVENDDGTLEFIDGVEIGVISFGLGANIDTQRADGLPGYTADPVNALAAAVTVGRAAGTTDYIGALESLVGMVATDMSSSDISRCEGGADDGATCNLDADCADGAPCQENRELQNARYVNIFLSDGIPDNDSSFGADQICGGVESWIDNGRPPPQLDLLVAVHRFVSDLEELAQRYDVREITFNGGFMAAPNSAPEVIACGGNLIRAMTLTGNGVFRDFSSGERINFLFVDFTSFKRVFALKNFVVMNLNSRPFSDALYVEGRPSATDPTLNNGIIDSDGDGLTDELEDLVGSSPRLHDTDQDGFGDLLEFTLRTSGFDTMDPTDADCPADIDRVDVDGDGLRDCEERFLGTNPKRYDTDIDGFGDGIEALFGANPTVNDALLDVDFDGADNAREIRWHSRPDTDDVAFLSDHAYRYDVRETGVVDAQTCYTFSVTNVSLSSTKGADDPPVDPNAEFLPAPGFGGGAMEVGENRVIIEASEAPFDAPNEPGITRLACATARFDIDQRLKVPANGVISLPPEAFVDAREFDPTIHCIDPE